MYLVGEVFDSRTFSSFLGGLFSVRLLVVVFRLSEDLSDFVDFRCFFSGLESSRLLDFFRCLDLVSFLEDLRSSFLLDRLLFFLLFLSSSDSDSSLLSDLNQKKKQKTKLGPSMWKKFSDFLIHHSLLQSLFRLIFWKKPSTNLFLFFSSKKIRLGFNLFKFEGEKRKKSLSCFQICFFFVIKIKYIYF